MFIKLLAALLFLFWSNSSLAEPKELSRCMACHATEKSERSCVRCHTSSWRDSELRNVSGLYASAPGFDDKYLSRIRPFDNSGLEKFLINPPNRRRHFGGMFGMNAAAAHNTAQAMSAWTQESVYQADEERVQEGAALFERLRCLSCHGESEGAAPVLPIGRQLYTFQYVAKLIRGENSYYSAQRQRLMPKYKNLSDEEIKALYSFISLEFPRPIFELNHVSLMNRSLPKLYKDVGEIFRRNGCLHCHGDADAASETKTLFGGNPELFKLKSKDGAVSILASPAIFQKDSKGENNLIRILLERRREEQNQDSSKLRGMPLTLPALKDNELRIIKQWISADCPTETERLCSNRNGGL